MKKLFPIPVLALGVLLHAQSGSQPIEWRHWGGDAAQTKYSTAADITTTNIQHLELAWTWRTIDRAVPEHDMRPGGFETTPLMIDNVVYVTTSFHRIVALDADTGAQLWVFDPKTYEEGPPLIGTGLNSRGLAFWRGDGGETRLLIAGRQRLFSVDAKTGQARPRLWQAPEPRPLLTGLSRDMPRLHTQSTSPPVVYKNLVIVGSGRPGSAPVPRRSAGHRAGVRHPHGQARLGVLHHPAVGQRRSAPTLGKGSWKYAGHANVWAPMALDEARGLLYVADEHAERRLLGRLAAGRNLFAESLVCLDAATGERKWHFQAVHHGLWDYDFGSPPNLVTITVDGKTIDAVAQVSKQGFTYVFDRVTGRPVWPIEERPVDTTTDVPGERPIPRSRFRPSRRRSPRRASRSTMRTI